MGNSVIVELKVLSSEVHLNELHINQILYGIPPLDNWPIKDSVSGPGFGQSGSCHINAICDAGWDAERHGIAQVVDRNGGRFSAALIMNTCGTNKPYILTANHCVVDANGNTINQNSTTFEFLWFSPTCTPTSNTTATLLFNGATIRARWEQTDFALLELNQTIPTNANLNFLGWSRSTNTPVSSVGIHHPMGDIMKIAHDYNPAVIGNVRTYLSTAWRVVWDDGASEGGASGSPLFDIATHRVIGQLFSNTQNYNPPCNLAVGGTNYGRFDLSWTGGGTSSTRLSDWLDPSNSAAFVTNTTNISNLIPSIGTLEIIGNESVCTGTKTYTLYNNGIPNTGSISWISSDPNIATISAIGNPATLSQVSGGKVTITATTCGNTVTKTIQVGSPDISQFSFLVSGAPCITYNNQALSFGIGYNGYWGCQLKDLIGITDVEWMVMCPKPYQVTYNSGIYNCLTSGKVNNAGISVAFSYPSQPYVVTMLYRVKNECGWSEWSPGNYHFIQACSGGWYFVASPNPTTGDVAVSLDEQTLKSDNTAAIKELQVLDKTGKPVKQFKFGTGNKRVNISLSGLKSDTYFINVFNGKEWKGQQVVKQ